MLAVVPGTAIGVVANPMSGRDIRRLVARASVFPNAEKVNMVLRVVEAAGALGVETVLVSTDTMGVAAGVLRASGRRGDGPASGRAGRAIRWPKVEFVEPGVLTGTATDTRALVRRMRERGAGAVVLLGGDGTVRAAAPELGGLPVLPLSTGTNNAFPEMWEATVAGSAVSLLATGRVGEQETTYRAKALHVTAGAREETALVDVCVNTAVNVGSRALWEVASLRELHCTFGEPHAIGLSSIVGLTRPTGRHEPHGVSVTLDLAAHRRLLAPIAPGVLAPVGIAAVDLLEVGESRRSAVAAGTVAVDGEREIEFGPRSPVTVTLARDGPRVLDVRVAMALAAERGLLDLEAPETPTEPATREVLP